MFLFNILGRVVIIIILIANSILADGTYVVDGFVSAVVPPSLNSTNNERLFKVYLPDGYATSTERYPVVYFLHGLHGNYESFDAGLKEILDRSIGTGITVPVIVIKIDASATPLYPGGLLDGTWYVD